MLIPNVGSRASLAILTLVPASLAQILDLPPITIKGNYWFSRTCAVGSNPLAFVDWSVFDPYDDARLDYWNLDPTAAGSGGVAKDQVGQQEIAHADYGIAAMAPDYAACLHTRGPHGRHGALFIGLPDADGDTDPADGDFLSTVGTQPWAQGSADTGLLVQYGSHRWSFAPDELSADKRKVEVKLLRDLANASVSAILHNTGKGPAGTHPRVIVSPFQNQVLDQNQFIVGFHSNPTMEDVTVRVCSSGPNLVPDQNPLVDETQNPRLMQRDQCNPLLLHDFAKDDVVTFEWILRPPNHGYLTYAIASTLTTG